MYVRNLEERIKLPELTEALTELFSEYGTILEIVAKKNLKAKGQAFIVFDNAESAEKAIEEVQGFEIFGKEMKLEKARTRSDAFVEKVEGPEGLEKWKRVRGGEKGMCIYRSSRLRQLWWRTTVMWDLPASDHCLRDRITTFRQHKTF